jgi:hypothetical protein
MGLYAFWRGESRAYGQWDGSLLLARRIQSLHVYGKGPGQEFRLCFCFAKTHVSSATYTVSSSLQVEENSGQLLNAPKTWVCKVPAAQTCHKATLTEEELRHNNTIIPNVPPPAPLTPATQPPPESPNQQPPAVKRAVRRLGIGDQQSAESSLPPALERSSSPASVQDWLPMNNHYPTRPPPAPRRDQTPLSCSEYDAEYDSDGYP